MVNLLTCSASSWRGAGDLCRWCNTEEVRGGRIFCSVECSNMYQLQHRYFLGREYVLMWSAQECRCPDSYSPQGAYNLGPPTFRVVYRKAGQKPHRKCMACGECEEQIKQRDDYLTVNHVEPRNGIEMTKRDCIHHLDNLEPLCWRCHAQLNRLGNVRERLTSWIASGHHLG